MTRGAARPRRAVAGWTARLVRRGVVLLAVAAAAYLVLEVASFTRTYPDGVSAEQFAIFVDNPAARTLQGVPHGVDTAGGFAVWDAGWILQLVVGVWALLTTTRLLRGEEDAGRAELLLLGPVRAAGATVTMVLVVAGGCLVVGAGAAAGLAGAGADPAGALLFGLGLAGFAATIASVAALAAQVVGVRRRAAGAAAAALVLAFVVRMVANSTDERAWLAWATPFGWMDRLAAFEDPDPVALGALVLAPAVLVPLVALVRARRDTGGALLAGSDRRTSHLRGLGGSAGWAWRSGRGVLLGWVLGLGGYAFVLGGLLETMVDFIAGDANYRRAMAELGLGDTLTTQGFLGVMGVVFGVGFALEATWRVGAARAEEESGRAENLLTRPVTRRRWLAEHAGLTLLGAGVVIAATGAAMWLGAVLAGSRTIGLGDALASVANTGPVVVLVTGVAVLTFGLLPRLTVLLPVSLTVAAYVVTLLGPALSWPQRVLDLSPFTHLAYVPAESFAATPAVVMAALGLLAALAGAVAFSRRDLAGA